MDRRGIGVLGVALAAGAALAWALVAAPWARPAAPRVGPVVSPPEAGGAEPETVAPEPRRAARSRPAAPEPAAADGRTLTVVVSTHTSLSRTGQPVARTRVAAGCGPPYESSDRALARGVTDDDGRVELALPWRAVEAARADPDARLWARPTEPGVGQRTRTAGLPATPDEPVAIGVVAGAGHTVRGRVVDAAGAGVEGYVRARRDPLGRGYSGGGGSTDDAGRFELTLSEPGAYALLAEAGSRGTGVRRDVAVPCAEDVELVLRGPGVVRGRVRDAAGVPAAGLDVLALAAALDDDAGSFVLPEPAATVAKWEGRGRTWAQARTGSDGSFEVTGLRDERYVVRARVDEAASGYPVLLTPVAVPADGAPLDLRFARPHLVVRVVGPDGRTVDGVRYDAHRWDDPPRAWPKELRVVVAPPTDEAQARDLYGTLYPGGPTEAGELVYEVEDGARYLVGLFGGGHPWAPTEVFVPAGASRHDVVLTAPAARPTGTLAVSVVDAAERALVDDLEIRIEEPDTGRPLVVDDLFWREEWPQRYALPEGDYRLVVRGAPFIDSHHGTLMEPRAHGRWEDAVRVAAGAETAARAVLPAGARLCVRLAGAVDEADRAAVRARGDDLAPEEVDAGAAVARLALVRPGTWPETVWFTEEWHGSSAAGTHRTDRLALGAEDTSQVLSAGRWRLEARLPGGRVASAPVALVDGETAEVALEFGPGGAEGR